MDISHILNKISHYMIIVSELLEDNKIFNYNIQ